MRFFSHKVPPGVRPLVRLPWTRAQLDRDLDDEWRFHLAERAAELRALGMSEPEAMAEALRRFGDPDALHADFARAGTRRARVLRVFDWLDDWAYDLRFAIRQFRRAPAFSVVAVLTLALGIGANTAIFTVVNRLLIDPVPYPAGDRVVALRQVAGDGSLVFPVAGSMLHAWSSARSLEAMANFGERAVHADEVAEHDSVEAGIVTTDFMRVLGLRPALGRMFTRDESRTGSGVAMIGHSLWRSLYAGRRNALGAAIHIDGKPYSIVGVTPSGMAVPMSLKPAPQIWLPYDIGAIPGATFGAFARLRPGVTTDAASAELQAIVRTLPDTMTSPGLLARTMRPREFIEPRETTTLTILFAAVGLLVLMACANLANLLLGRAWNRRREFAVRVALGAGRSRLVRQVLTESVTLAVVGGLVGLLFAWEGLRVIVAMRQQSLDHLVTVHVDTAAFFWSAALSLGSGILFGAAPAVLAAGSMADSLRIGAGTGATNRLAARVRGGLVVAEVALAFVVLIGAGLLVRTLVALEHVNLGFDRRGLVSVGLRFARGTDEVQRTALRGQVVARVAALPGVRGAAVGTLPSTGFLVGAPVERDGDAPSAAPVKSFTAGLVSPNYFSVAGIALIEGRTFDSSSSDAHEAVVNRALAQRLWPAGNAVGSRYRTGPTADWTTVVGIAEDVRVPWFGGDRSDLQIYTRPPTNMYATGLLVRSDAPLGTLVPMLRHVIGDVDSRITLGQATTSDELLAHALSPSRFATTLLGAFGVIALALSVVGLYGVVAYAVTQRTREIGVRITLGAQPNDVRRLVIGHGLRLTALGVLVGVAGAAASVRSLDSLLYGIGPSDPTTFIVATIVLVAVAVVASIVPARRALRIDPMEALRAD